MDFLKDVIISLRRLNKMSNGARGVVIPVWWLRLLEWEGTKVEEVTVYAIRQSNPPLVLVVPYSNENSFKAENIVRYILENSVKPTAPNVKPTAPNEPPTTNVPQ